MIVTICDGCNVREPFEHRCHGSRMQVRGENVIGACQCEDCKPFDYGGSIPECPSCGRVMSSREAYEQGACNDCRPEYQR